MGVAEDVHTNIDYQVVNTTTTNAVIVVKGDVPKDMSRKLTKYQSDTGLVKLKAIGYEYRVYEVVTNSEYDLARVVMYFDIILNQERGVVYQ